jgi:hypothetical protein
MSGHEYIGVNIDVVVVCRFPQPMQIAVIVVIGKETGATIVATLDDMLRYSWLINTGAARHIRQSKSFAARD